MKAKEWLHKNGFIAEIGRGRISGENHARLAESGQTFSDWPKGVVMVEEVTDAATGEVEDKVTYHRTDGYTSTGEIAEIAPYRYNHDTHAVYEDNADGTKGKRRSLREVCKNDGVSLVQCGCGAPEVVATDGRGHVAVTIYAETSKPVQGNVWDKRK